MYISKVMKFGGTSVGSPERFKALINLINDGDTKVVVLSAMAGTTNSLIAITDAALAGNKVDAVAKTAELKRKYYGVVDETYSTDVYKQRAITFIDERFDLIEDTITNHTGTFNPKIVHAQGEILSTTIFHFLLQERKIGSVLLQALNFMRVDRDGEPDYFFIDHCIQQELAAKHKGEKIIITQGFICRDFNGEIDNLKRGGSDYSASIIGAVLGVGEIQIWTDIDGIHNNDPRHVDNTKVISELSFDEAAELAYFGAKILHPSTIIPARERNIPVRLKDTMHPAEPGTFISDKESFSDYKAIAAKDGITVIRIHSYRMLMAYGFLRKIFDIFEEYRTPIDMIATSEVSVSLTIDDPTHLSEIVADLEKYGHVEVEMNQTIICIVGDFRPETRGSAPEIFDSLDNITLKMISYGGSSHSLSLLIDTIDKEEALRSLNTGLFCE